MINPNKQHRVRGKITSIRTLGPSLNVITVKSKGVNFEYDQWTHKDKTKFEIGDLVTGLVQFYITSDSYGFRTLNKRRIKKTMNE